MKKEMYDASIHIGQFSLDEDIRIRCKNAQASIASKQQVCLDENNPGLIA